MAINQKKVIREAALRSGVSHGGCNRENSRADGEEKGRHPGGMPL